MKLHWDVEVQIRVFLTWGLVTGESSASCHGFNPGYPLDWRLGEPHCQYEPRGEEKTFDPIGNRNPTPRAYQRRLSMRQIAGGTNAPAVRTIQPRTLNNGV
jgi:hypothetical protein